MTKGCGKKYFDKDLNEELYCDWSTICPECQSQEICADCGQKKDKHFFEKTTNKVFCVIDNQVLIGRKFKPKTQETPNHSPQTKQEEYSPNTNPAGYRSSDKEPSDKTEGTSKSQEYPKGHVETLSDKIIGDIANETWVKTKYVREFIAKIKKRVDDVTTLIYTRAMMKVMIDLEAGKGLI